MKAFLKKVFSFIPKLWRYLKARLSLKLRVRRSDQLIKMCRKCSKIYKRRGGNFDMWDNCFSKVNGSDRGDRHDS